jgi:hypothetical protein
VSRGDERCTAPRGLLAEKGVAGGPGVGFRARRLVQPLIEMREVPGGAEAADPECVSRAARAHPVVQVRHRQRERHRPGGFAEEVQENDRVASARNRDEQVRRRVADPELPEAEKETLLQWAGRVHSVGAGAGSTRAPDAYVRSFSSERTPTTPSTSQASSVAYRISS